MRGPTRKTIRGSYIDQTYERVATIVPVVIRPPRPRLHVRPYPPTCDWCGGEVFLSRPLGEQVCSAQCGVLCDLYGTEAEA